MPIPLSVLILEDSAADAELEVYEIKQAGFEPDWTRVQTEADFVDRLQPGLDLIIADYRLPQFDGGRALQRLQESGLDVPFIIVSGAIGEELAVSLMKQGVADYLQKDRLTRLGQAVSRALEQRRSRREKGRAERALREREASYRELATRMQQQAKTFDTLLSAVPDMLFLLGPDQRVSYANRAMLTLFNRTLDDTVGRSFEELGFPPELVSKYASEFEQALHGTIVRSESAHATAAGGTAYHEYFFAPVFDEHERVVAIAGASRDITARKESEQVLRHARAAMEKQQQWLEMVLDLLPLPILMIEPGSGRTLFSNKAAERLYGGPVPKYAGADPLPEVYFTDTDEGALPLEQVPPVRAARGERLAGVEACWHTPAGRFHLSFYSEALPGTYGHPSVVVLMFQDIGHLKLIESSLRESIGQLERERELREIFVSTLSHDLRTPLMAARMSAELLSRRDGAKLNLPLLLGRIIENVDRLDGMIQTLLDANLVRAGERLPLQVRHCCLRQTVGDVLDELTTLHGDRYRLRGPQRLEGYWDPRLLGRIIENLANNAIKYGDPHAPVTITLEDAEDEVSIRVHNEGEPIDAGERSSLFEPFRRSANGRHSGKAGWGIGLTMVRGAAEAHGGRVSVESARGQGTTFIVVLRKDTRPLAHAVAD